MADPKYGVVVMLDALGSSSMSIQESTEFIESRNSIVKNLESQAAEFVSVAANLQKPFEQPKLVTFGDTIILTWEIPQNAPEIYLPILASWLTPLIYFGMKNKMLLRGAISIGEFIQDGSTVLGPAVADAASWYDQAQWIGIIATPRCSIHVKMLNEISKIFGDTREKQFQSLFVEYSVPVKGSRTVDLCVVGWPQSFFYFSNFINIYAERRSFLKFLSGFSIPFGTEEKYANTLTFFDWYSENCYAPKSGEDISGSPPKA